MVGVGAGAGGGVVLVGVGTGAGAGVVFVGVGTGAGGGVVPPPLDPEPPEPTAAGGVDPPEPDLGVDVPPPELVCEALLEMPEPAPDPAPAPEAVPLVEAPTAWAPAEGGVLGPVNFAGAVDPVVVAEPVVTLGSAVTEPAFDEFAWLGAAGAAIAAVTAPVATRAPTVTPKVAPPTSLVPRSLRRTTDLPMVAPRGFACPADLFDQLWAPPLATSG